MYFFKPILSVAIALALLGSRTHASAQSHGDGRVGETDTVAQPKAAPNTIETQRRPYLSAGAIYLPVDDGLAAASAGAGLSFIRTERIEARAGARLMFGEGYYASAFALVGHGQMHAWWGTYGISATVGAGPIFASRKRTSGWDGLLAGLVVEASPVRLRFDAFEPSLDVGFLYAVGNDYPAPYVLPSLTYHL